MRVAVLGVGLVGGSIGLAARARAGALVTGFDPDPEVLERAVGVGALDTPARSVAEAVAEAQVVFAAAPVGVLAQTVAEALASAGPDCVVSDVGSTKRPLLGAGADARFIGGHPLAGAETAGVENAREDLFEGATWYLTPAAGTAGVLYERLHRLLTTIGAHPTAIDPDTHDGLMACVSHLPHVLANLLVAQAASLVGEGEERLPAAGPSFRDATRVAGANSAIWTDIYRSNASAVLAAIGELQRRLEHVRELLVADDPQAISAWNEDARGQRDAVLGAGLAGGSLHELRVAVPNRPGVIADIALALGGAGVNIVDLALSPSPDNSQGVVALWVRGEREAARAGELIRGLGFPVAAA